MLKLVGDKEKAAKMLAMQAAAGVFAFPSKYSLSPYLDGIVTGLILWGRKTCLISLNDTVKFAKFKGKNKHNSRKRSL